MVTSANKTVHYDKVRGVTVPSVSGSAQILFGHAEAFMVLEEGDINLDMSNRAKEIIPIVKGECYVRDNKVVIIL